MIERCSWPRCTQAPTGSLRFGTKVWPLCDHHCDLVHSLDKRVASRSRKKIGIPPIEKYHGRALAPQETADCSFPGCSYPASAIRYRSDGVHAPVCNKHKLCEDYSYTGSSSDTPAAENSVVPLVPETTDEVLEEEPDFSAFEARLASGSYDWEDD